ncbi:hypothetical protein [Pseudomonas sp. CGJS7]|uniref:hypothetical protein n=1 Tax=Pseudomonas sp. CGJS7 TaxID=3109348 RepID=UPI00300AF08E
MRNWATMTDGLSSSDKARANRIRLGLEGRASGAGIGFGEFVGGDGIKRPTRENPRTGVLEVLYNNQWMPADGMQGALGSAQGMQSGQVEDPLVQEILAKANDMSRSGVAPDQIEQWISGQLQARGTVTPWQWQTGATGTVQGGSGAVGDMGGLLGDAVAQAAPSVMPVAAPPSALAGPTAAQEAYGKTMAEERARLAAYDDMT